MKPEIRTKKIIWIMMFATLILSCFGGFVIAPNVVKSVYFIAMLFSLLFFPFPIVKRNDIDKTANIVLRLIALFTFAAVCQTAFTDSGVHIGNKWVTMFANPECMFMVLAPFFAYLGSVDNSIIYLKRAMQIFLILGVCGLLYLKFIPLSILWFSIVFFPYVSKVYKIIILLSILMGFYSAFFAEETSRTTALTIVFAFFSLFLPYVIGNRLLIKFFCYSVAIIPIIYAVYTIIVPEYSIIEVILDFVLDKTGDTTMATDTRTFLFREMSDDLNFSDSWLFGKGAYSHYHSNYFSRAEGDCENRMGCEVTFLQCLLRGGISYTFCYFSILVLSVFRITKYSKNKFLLSVAIMISGWIFVACMSFLNGFSFKHLGFFILVGCGLSSRWLEKTDGEIEQML